MCISVEICISLLKSSRIDSYECIPFQKISLESLTIPSVEIQMSIYLYRIKYFIHSLLLRISMKFYLL